MSTRLDGKIAIITGSSSGLGEATALHFAQLGAWVTLCGRNKERLEATRQKCVEAGGGKSDHFWTVLGDLREPEIRNRIVDETVAKFGRLDIVVANAGSLDSFGSFESITEESYDLLHATNIKSVIFLLQRAAPHLIEAKGSIVTVGSMASATVLPHMFTYSLTKAALDNMVRILSIVLGPKGVRVNNVRPGAFVTNIDRHSEMTFDDMKEPLIAATPLHRFGLPIEVAKAVAFLVSEDAGFINGADLVVDGGITLVHPLNVHALSAQ